MDSQHKPNRFLITAALPYANGPVHLGHLAGCYLPADIFARYQRLKGNSVAFICGSDEHGVGISIKATQEGITPQELVDKYHPIIKQSFADFGISFDWYSRTSNATHKKTAQEFFKTLYDKGVFIKKTSAQFYDTQFNQFLADRYITGTCPNCGYDKAYGDQCEKCGKSLDPSDLINPISSLSGKTPEVKETEHWYLPLQNFEEWLKDWILEGKKDWKPNVYGQCKSWITQGLQERAVTRDLTWGVPVPLPDAEGKVLYVWFDAPIGYITATQEWAEANGKDWELYWKNEDTQLVHFIGKDNIVFHCIVFPSMLKAHGDYILPTDVPANEFLNLEGDKISTSRNWAVWLHEYLIDFPNRQDTLRYVLTANAPETKDNDFTWKDFQAKNNNELVAVLGNLVNRINVLTHKYYGGIVPKQNGLGTLETDLLQELSQAPNKIATSIEKYTFRDGLQELISLARATNKYLTETEPWKQYKTNPDQVETVLYTCTQVLATLAICSEPFMPQFSKQLKVALGIENTQWQDAGNPHIIPSGAEFKKLEILFQQVSDEEIDAQINKLNAKKVIPNKMDSEQPIPSSIPPQKENITYDDFLKLDLRVATVLDAKKVEKADKLLELTLDAGIDTRTVVSGIAEHYQLQDLIGKQVIIVANLEPRKLRGITSQGMILMAGGDNSPLLLVSPVETAQNGDIVK